MKRCPDRRRLPGLVLFLLGLLAAGVVASPSPGSVAVQRGLSLWKERDPNRYPEVATAFRNALTDDPQNPNYHSLLGRILLDMGDIPGASAELSWCLGFRPYDKTVIAATHLAQGQCWELKGQPDKARVEYDKVLATHVGGALEEEASTRALLCRWHHDRQSHCVLVSETGLSSQAGRCEATLARACSRAGVELSYPVLVYVLRTDTDARKLQVSAGEVLDGRQQVYLLTSSAADAWDLPLARVVAARMGPQHVTDSVIRHGVFIWLTDTDDQLSGWAADKRVPLAQLRAQTGWGIDSALEAGVFVQYLVKTYGVEALRTLWSHPQAEVGAQEAYHKTLADLESEWTQSLRAR